MLAIEEALIWHMHVYRVHVYSLNPCFIVPAFMTTQRIEIFSIGGGVASQSNGVWSEDGEDFSIPRGVNALLPIADMDHSDNSRVIIGRGSSLACICT
jgi:hypothetical protein